MSYCLNPDCPNPGEQKSPNPEGLKFCTNCGSQLLLCDRYRALKTIGEGVFGKTFVGIDCQKPSRPRCIIKQFTLRDRSSKNSEKAADLFHREAIQLDQLGQHPQIPTLLAYFEQPPHQYLVQEFIDGKTLTQELQTAGPFNEEQIWQLLRDLLPILDFVHTHQIVHRNIKPQNIIRRQPNNQPVLLGFGAAKLSTPASQQETATKIGTPGYMAPEQAIGRPLFASDLYSLGVTCIQLLTHTTPKHLLDPQNKTWIWRQKLQHPISQPLGQILDKLLCGNLQDRYQSAAVVLQDIKAKWPSAAIDSAPLALSANAYPAIPASAPPVSGPLATWECYRTLLGHQTWVKSIAISADGRILASSSSDKTIKLWTLKTGKLLRTLDGHTGWVRAIAISPDSRILASASDDQTIRLWDIDSGKLHRTLKGHTDWIHSILFIPQPDSSSQGTPILASGSQDRTIKLWPLSQPDTHRTLTGHKHWILTLAVSPDGHTLASGSHDQTIGLWDRQTGEAYHFLSGHTDKVMSVDISPDGKALASGSTDNTIKLWNLNTCSLLTTLTGHSHPVNAVSFSPDSKTLVSGSSDKTIKRWNIETGQLIDNLTGHAGWVWTLAHSPDGSILASGGWEGNIKLWQKVATTG